MRNTEEKRRKYESKETSIWISELFSDMLLLLWSIPLFWMKDQLFTHVALGGKIWNRAILMLIYIYIMVALKFLIEHYWTKKNLFWLLFVGFTPAAVILSVRWYSKGSVVVIFAAAAMIVYSLVLLWQMIGGRGNWEVRVRRWKKGMERILGCFCILAFVGGAAGKIGITEADQKLELVISERENLFETNEAYLRLWQDEEFSQLNKTEKMELFQKLADLECQYLGIDPVIVEQEKYENEKQRGYYSEYGRILSISKKLLDADRMDALETLLHECHHAYAHDLVNYVVIADLLEKTELRMFREVYRLKDAFENYVEAEEDYTAYYWNPVEVEARAYAKERMEVYLWFVDGISDT